MATRKKQEEKIQFEKFVSERGEPNSPDIEMAVLGAMLLEREAIETVFKLVKSSDIFFDSKHQIIFNAILNIREEKSPVDILTVTEKLITEGKLTDAGGAWYITDLTNKVASGAHVEKHSMILFQYFMRRNLTKYAMNLYDLATDMTVDEFQTFDDSIVKLDAMKVSISSMRDIDFSNQVTDTLKGIFDGMNGKEISLKTGLTNVDQITGGRIKGELTILAARPSMGKTSRAVKEIINISLGSDSCVGLISLETKYRQIIQKILSNLTGIDSNLIRLSQLSLKDYDSLYEAHSILKSQRILISDVSTVNISDVRAIAMKWKSQHDLSILYVDYLTLIKPRNPYSKSSKNDDVEEIANGLKGIAMDLDIPVVALAQLNREADRRTDKRPVLSDLRDSGGIEQAADVVSFLFRPEYYGETADSDGTSLVGMTEELIRKNRNGTIGDAYHRFIPQTNDFQPLGFVPNYKKRSNSYSENGQAKQLSEPTESEAPPF